MSKININIEAENPEEFRKILQGLLGDVKVTVNQVNVKSDDPDRAVQQMTDAGKAKPTTKPKPEAAAKPATGPKLVDPATEFAEAPKEEPKAAEPAKEAAKPEPKASTKKAAPAPDTNGAAPSPELPDNIKNTNSMRDLLTYLAEHGVDSVDAMVATCTVLKKDVPILSKVPNVEERVRRALDVLALFPAPAEGDAAQA